MKGYVVCTRVANPLKPLQIVPKLYLYMSDFEVKSSTSAWCVCIVDDVSQTPIPAAAQADPDIFVFDTTGDLDRVLSTPQRNAVNTELSTTDWQIAGVPVQAVAGNTVRIVLDKIRQALGHTAASWGLGL